MPWTPGAEPDDDDLLNAISYAAQQLIERRDSWLTPEGATAEDLRERTLTNLYNLNPQWLLDAHSALNKAVLSAYGWPANSSEDETLEKLLALNRKRAAKPPEFRA
jgi:hypothetical protein